MTDDEYAFIVVQLAYCPEAELQYWLNLLDKVTEPDQAKEELKESAEA